MRACQQAERGPEHERAPAGSGAEGPRQGDPDPGRVLEAVQVQVRLGLRDDAPGGAGRQADLLPAREDARRVQRDERDDAPPRPPGGLRCLARRLGLGGDEAVPPGVRGGVVLRLRREGPQPDDAGVPRRRRAVGRRIRERPPSREPRGRGTRARPSAQGAPLHRRRRVAEAGPRAGQPDDRDRRPGPRNRLRRPARRPGPVHGRGRGGRARADTERGRDRLAAAPPRLRRGTERRARGARNRGGPRRAGGRPQPPRPPDGDRTVGGVRQGLAVRRGEADPARQAAAPAPWDAHLERRRGGGLRQDPAGAARARPRAHLRARPLPRRGAEHAGRARVLDRVGMPTAAQRRPPDAPLGGSRSKLPTSTPPTCPTRTTCACWRREWSG